jgi:exodeoxyribonuclease-3
VKIVSWNINSVRFRIGIVEQFLRENEPDILCLQETKVIDGDFPLDAFRALGYKHIVLHGQRMHHGVAILSRVPIALDDRLDWQANQEARHVGVQLENGVRLENVYVPAGGDVPDRDANPKFGQKLDFVERMTRWSESLACPTILVGDFNIAPLESDVWSHKQLLDVVSHTPIEVEALGRLQAAGPISAAISIPPPPASTPGGATARRTGRPRTAAAVSTICGPRKARPSRPCRIPCSNPAAAGSNPPITCRS